MFVSLKKKIIIKAGVNRSNNGEKADFIPPILEIKSL
tara:strand:- start:149 stop:259 length:111 start_codon:yes stop_codon:yes gene_type:complete